MGKPVKSGGKQQQQQAPPKRQREPSPPSESESEASVADSDGGMLIPPLDVALLIQLREKEMANAFASLQAHAGLYRSLYTKLAEWKAKFILEQVQPVVREALGKSTFYEAALKNSCRAGDENGRKTHLKATSIGMRNGQLEAAASKGKAAGKIVVPYTVEDIVPIIRCDDGDEPFLAFTTAVTVSYLVDEALVESSKLTEAYHAVQYEFHLAPEAITQLKISNSSLRVRFFTQGGIFYRQGLFAPGRIVDIQADAFKWTNPHVEKSVLEKMSPFSIFKTLFTGLHPAIPEEATFTAPASHVAIRKVLEKHLGNLAAVPPKELALVDIDLLQRVFAVYESTGINLPPLNERKDNKNSDANDDDEEEEELDTSDMEGRLSEYIAAARALGEKAASGKALTTEEELDIVRRIVLVNVPVHYFADSILNIVATAPQEAAVMFALEDDDEEEEGEEGEEEEEDDEGDFEEESEDEAPPAKPAGGKGPSPKGAAAPGSAKGKPPGDCKQQ